MKIEYALLADAAQAVGGKVFVLGGGWNLFRSASYPAPVQFAVAIGLGFSRECDEESASFPLGALDPDSAAVSSHQRTRHGEPEPQSGSALVALEVGLDHVVVSDEDHHGDAEGPGDEFFPFI